MTSQIRECCVNRSRAWCGGNVAGVCPLYSTVDGNFIDSQVKYARALALIFVIKSNTGTRYSGMSNMIACCKRANF